MTVFKGYLYIMKKCLPNIILYFVITMGITMAIQMATQSTTRQAFEATSLKVGIVDADGGSLAKGLREYIGQVHDVEILADDKSSIQENLFYQNIHCVIRIPKDFEKSGLQDKEPLEVTSIPNAFGAFYVEQRVDTFLHGVSVYSAAEYPLEESIQLVLASGEKAIDVQILDVNGNGGQRQSFSYMLEYIPYLFITAICSSFGVVMGVFNNKEIRRKMLSSPLSLKRQNMEQVLAFLIMGIGFLVVTLLVMTGIHKLQFWKSENMWYFLGNVISMLLVSLALAFAIGIMMKKMDSITSITTVLSMVLCFLGGVFVPLELLGEGVKRFSRFLPTYWYETNLYILIERQHLSSEIKTEIFKGYGLQLAFALACMALALAVVKYRSQEN